MEVLSEPQSSQEQFTDGETEAVVPSLDKEEIDSPSSPIDMDVGVRNDGTADHASPSSPIDNNSPGGSTDNLSEFADLITDKVKEEQVKLEEKARQEEEEEYRQRKEIWMKMDDDTKEMRYKKLEALLQKSTMFTEYIIKRMEQQKEEEKARRGKWLNNFAEKKPNSESSQEEKVSKASDTKDTPKASKRSLRAPVPRSRLSVPNSPALSEVQSSPRTPTLYDDERVSEKGDGDSLDDSGSTQLSEKENESVVGRRKTRSGKTTTLTDLWGKGSNKKRKAADTISPKQVLQPLSTKKRKMENKEKATEELEKSTKNVENKKNELQTTTEELGARRPVIAEDGTVLKPAYFTGGDLRQYQVEGLNWLTVLYLNGVNGILADEMGLGKTIQCIALIAQIVTMGAKGPFMIVAPLSTLPNWSAEFKKFAPMLPVVFYHGKKEDREKIRKQISKQHQVSNEVSMRPVVITSFEVAMIDKRYLQNHRWTYIIVDEGHRIKNKDCRLIRELRTYVVDHRLLLTGTPLQNNLRELWSLLNFLIPEIFDDLGSFESWFDVELISDEDADQAIVQEEQKKHILGMLHLILTPFMLRRVKTDVDLCIPPKKELLVYAPLTKHQEEFYASTVDKTILDKIEAKNNPVEEVELGPAGRPKRWTSKKRVDYSLMVESSRDVEGRNKKKFESDLDSWLESIVANSTPMQRAPKAKVSQVTVRLQNVMMQLRKCCNHPYLLEYPLDESGEFKVDEDLVKKSGKMLILDKMLPELKKGGHKVLLFSQMTKMLDVLEDYCILRKIVYRRLDGSCNVDDRRESIDAFNTDPEVFVFLLSTRAGGLGLNLMAADTVIIYDSDWNPQNDLQAQDRCHRIGQTRPVMVYRFVTANTIDQRIVERASAKRKLEKMVILKGKFKSGIKNFTKDVKPLSPEELLELLKSKDYHGCIQQDSEVISKKELEELLDRSDIIAEHERNTEEYKSGKKSSKESPRLETKSKLFDVVDFDEGSATSLKKD